jgi:hypothetical protein
MKGTLCPEWTHRTPAGGFAADEHQHDWPRTLAADMFSKALVDVNTGRRFYTMRGLAFEAKDTKDGSWHGFPVPWESVSPMIVRAFKNEMLVSNKDLKKYYHFDRTDIYWPLETDVE